MAEEISLRYRSLIGIGLIHLILDVFVYELRNYIDKTPTLLVLCPFSG